MSAGAKALASVPDGWIRLSNWWTQTWHDSGTNPWGFALEQRTYDGRYRSRTFDDNMNSTAWQKGPHPIAQKLRDEGKTYTDRWPKGVSQA